MNVFRLEGEYWTVEYQGAVFRLRDGKGLHYLAYLLHHPGEQVAVEVLIERSAGNESRPSERDDASDPRLTSASEAERARSAVSKRIKDALKRIQSHHPALGRHLARCIKTGRTCGYLPDSSQALPWVQ